MCDGDGAGCHEEQNEESLLHHEPVRTVTAVTHVGVGAAVGAAVGESVVVGCAEGAAVGEAVTASAGLHTPLTTFWLALTNLAPCPEFFK
jgi:hypothetical protein